MGVKNHCAVIVGAPACVITVGVDVNARHVVGLLFVLMAAFARHVKNAEARRFAAIFAIKAHAKTV